jgi:hypothetical protein
VVVYGRQSHVDAEATCVTNDVEAAKRGAVAHPVIGGRGRRGAVDTQMPRARDHRVAVQVAVQDQFSPTTLQHPGQRAGIRDSFAP